MISQLEKAYWSLEKRLAPGLGSAQLIYSEILDRYVDSETCWLDIGCGHQLFDSWIKGEEALIRRAKLVVGSDPDYSSLRNHRSINHRVVAFELPLRSRSFSLITANMVMEHVTNPASFFCEIYRLLRPGGRFIVHTPNAWNWHVWASRLLPTQLKYKIIHLAEGRHEDDVYPTYYRANTSSKLREKAVSAGLDMQELTLCDTSTPSRMALGPLVVVDLLLIRLQRRESLAGMRSNMIGIFRAPATNDRLA